jgi:hypothetical protein
MTWINRMFNDWSFMIALGLIMIGQIAFQFYNRPDVMIICLLLIILLIVNRERRWRKAMRRLRGCRRCN